MGAGMQLVLAPTSDWWAGVRLLFWCGVQKRTRYCRTGRYWLVECRLYVYIQCTDNKRNQRVQG